MSAKYEYLKQYIDYNKNNPYDNWFSSIDEDEIRDSEKRLGFQFPEALKEFWKQIGYGFFNSSKNAINTTDNVNRLMDPYSIADIILLKEESGLILPEAVEYMEPDEMPFFEIGDMSSFLYMKPLSSKPNAVWGYSELIEEDFEKFIWRLYYESPTYYLDKK